MPASPRLRPLHHLGSNARIYIAQECKTRGSRGLHLHVQEHNSRHERLKDARVDLLWRASKKMPASTPMRASKRCPHHLIRAWKDTRHPLSVHKEMHVPRHTRG